MSRALVIYVALLAALTSCEPITVTEQKSTPFALLTPVKQSIESTIRVSSTDQIKNPTVTLTQPSADHPGEYQTIPPWDKTDWPVFLEIVQTTQLGESDMQGSSIGVGPPAYFYDQQSKALLLDPKITLELETQLLIGFVQALQTSNQAYDKREIIQFPFVQPAPIQIVAHDLGSDTLTIIFADEKFDLMPGEQRTFKQAGTGPNSPAVMTIISNHGQPAEIQLVFFDGSVR